MQIYEGLQLMVIGMSTVIGFLCLLVVLMHCSAALFRIYYARFPEKNAVSSSQPPKTDRDIAIALAVVAHQKTLKKGA